MSEGESEQLTVRVRDQVSRTSCFLCFRRSDHHDSGGIFVLLRFLRRTEKIIPGLGLNLIEAILHQLQKRGQELCLQSLLFSTFHCR